MYVGMTAATLDSVSFNDGPFDVGGHKSQEVPAAGGYLTAVLDHVSVALPGHQSLAVSQVTSSDTTTDPLLTRDGNFLTRWESYGNGQWVGYDLGSLKRVDSLGISWYGGVTPPSPPFYQKDRVQAFEINVSTNNVYFTTVFTGTSGPALPQTLEVYNFLPTCLALCTVARPTTTGVIIITEYD